MDKFAKISSIGLEAKDRTLIKSILKLSANLNDKFITIESSKYQSADLLFVNADDENSIKAWGKLKAQNKSVTPIMVTTSNKTYSDTVTLRRPLIINRVVAALESVVSRQLEQPQQYAATLNVGKRILIVDDSFSVRKYMEQKLPTLYANPQMIMDFADSGKSAMEKVKAAAYHIVFLDVVMPGVDGYKVCKWIKSVRPKTRVIMLTSKKSPFDKVRGSMSGCDAYLTKPPEDAKLKKLLTD